MIGIQGLYRERSGVYRTAGREFRFCVTLLYTYMHTTEYFMLLDLHVENFRITRDDRPTTTTLFYREEALSISYPFFYLFFFFVLFLLDRYKTFYSHRESFYVHRLNEISRVLIFHSFYK